MVPNQRITRQLAKLESHLQSLIEDGVWRYLGVKENPQLDLAANLAAALQAGIKRMDDGRIIAPNLFIMAVRQPTLLELTKDEGALQRLADEVYNVGTQAGFDFLEPVTIRIIEDSNLHANQVEIQAQIALENLTATTDLEMEEAAAQSEMPASAFLIIDGTRIFSLDQPIINIGRRPDNHLVIDDPRISRIHAQLRAIKGHFVIFDLESTGGTQVNGQLIHQAPLFPGDLISLAGLPMVYGQEQNHLGKTQKLGFSGSHPDTSEAIE